MYSVAKRFLGASSSENAGRFNYVVNTIDCNADGSIIVAQIQCDGSGPYYPTVLVSTNGGSSFSSVVVDSRPGLTNRIGTVGNGGQSNIVCNGTRFIIALNTTIYYSDNGLTWTPVQVSPEQPAGWQVIAATYQGGKFIVTYNSGTTGLKALFSSADGVTWTQYALPAGLSGMLDGDYPEQGAELHWIPGCSRYLVGWYTYNTSWADQQPVTIVGSGLGPPPKVQVIDGTTYFTSTFLGEMSTDGTTVTNLGLINSNNRFSQILPSSHDIYAIWGNITPYVGTLPSFPNLTSPPTAERTRLILAADQTQCISYDAINDIIKTISNTGLTETNVVSSANLSVGGNWFVGPIESIGMQGSSSYKRFFIRNPLAGSVPVAADDITTIPTIAVLTYSAGTYTLTHSTISI